MPKLGKPRQVFVLGAGFSRAIAAQMPLTTDLIPLINGQLAKPQRLTGVELEELQALGNDIESWLTILAQPQPFFDDIRNTENKARFLQISEALAQVIITRQNIALSTPEPPTWLVNLEKRWNENESTVITLNYDLLVEQASWSAHAQEYPLLWHIPVQDIRSRQSSTLGIGRYDAPCFTLLKLHGSVNWFAHESKESAIYYVGSPIWDWRTYDESELQWLIRDLRRTIVPPVTAKDPYLANSLMISQWRAARDAVAQATELHILGYSMPPADQTLRSLLAAAPFGTRGYVVNRTGRTLGRVQEALAKLDLAQWTTMGEKSIASFATAYYDKDSLL